MSDLGTCSKTWPDESASCKVCNAPFKTLQDCLAHELLKHTIKPQKKLRKCLDAITKLFASEQVQLERTALRKLFVCAQPGQHLHSVLGYYAGNSSELADCFCDVRKSIQKHLHGKVKVYPFGSLVTGLALKESDIDLYLEQTDDSSNCMTQRQLFNRTHNFLRRSPCFSDVFAIRHARVPIIRCKHVMSGLSLDINMASPNSTYNSRFVAELLNRDLRLRELFLFLKIWAKKLKIIGSGSMSSYCLIALIIYQLQQQSYLPSIQELQTVVPAQEVFGINYAFSLTFVRPLPQNLTTFDLITGFFELYSQMGFEKKVISPFLGRVLDVETAFSGDGSFPEYDDQIVAVQRATGELPELFQGQRCVCVQDPFELTHNVGQSISQTNLCYLNQCLVLATKACKDAKLRSAPDQLYEYLLFGLAENLLQEQQLDYLLPAKLRKQGQKTTPKPADAAAVKPSVAGTAESTGGVVDPIATTQDKLALNNGITVENGTMHVHVLTPTSNDLKSLRVEFLSKNRKSTETIFYHWVECYVDAIRDILLNIYALNMKEVDSSEPSTDGSLPRSITWLIDTSLDTWTSRSFQHISKQSFFAQQLQQTIEFNKTRAQNASYAVNLRGRFSLIIGNEYKEIRLQLQPMPGDALGLQRQSPLTKFFKSLKNMLCNYNFKEKVISMQYDR